MKKRVVAEVMTRDPLTISPNTSLLECAKKMVQKNTGSFLITEKNRLVGFISERDVLWAFVKKSKEDLSKISVMNIAIKKIATIKPDSTLEETITKMKKLKFRRLPVVQGKELVGMVTIKDILNFFPEIYPELSELDKVKEESEKLKRIKKSKEKEFTKQGICEECGGVDILYRIDGRLLCESCKDMM
ncbi:MAG: CBS domain-containing protein [archaeon]|nr:CBS domain-containing protein [archaeon]